MVYFIDENTETSEGPSADSWVEKREIFTAASSIVLLSSWEWTFYNIDSINPEESIFLSISI